MTAPPLDASPTELELIAGGRGSRIRDLVDGDYGGGPKHLLPVPGGADDRRTLLSAGIDQALACFARVRVHVAEGSVATFEAHTLRYGERVAVVVDREMTGPLGPIARLLLAERRTVLMFGGDAYCRFAWVDLLRYHRSHPLPVTALVANCPGAQTGARVVLERREDVLAVVGWERSSTLGPTDLVNIGAYVFDPTHQVLSVVDRLDRHTEDAVLGQLAAEGGLAAFVPGGPGFNVNTAETYRALCEHAMREEDR